MTDGEFIVALLRGEGCTCEPFPATKILCPQKEGEILRFEHVHGPPCPLAMPKGDTAIGTLSVS